MKWNEVTWYSRLGAIILFIGVIPVLNFYIGMQYGKVVSERERNVPLMHNRLVTPSVDLEKKSIEGIGATKPFDESLVYPNPSEEMLSSRVNKLVSPDGKVSAITYSSEEETVTFLVNNEDKHFSKVYWGGAQGWSSDSSKVYVFLADRFSTDGKRHMYYLNKDGSITDPKLPAGVYVMSISPDNQYIAYVRSQVDGSDAADIYLRDTSGDRILVEGQNNIFLKLEWSADSKTLFYEKSDLLFRPGMQSNWSIEINGPGEPQRLSR